MNAGLETARVVRLPRKTLERGEERDQDITQIDHIQDITQNIAKEGWGERSRALEIADTSF